ncbi:unnamed protein product, partial [Adineta steineri]
SIQTITSLNLECNKIQAEGIRYLAEMLQNNTTLTTFDLGWNNVRDDGAQYLANALQNNTVR